MKRANAIALAFGLALAAVAAWRAAPASVPAHAIALPAAPRVVFRGGDAAEIALARGALARVFATPTGGRAFQLLDSLARPLTIELNRRGENFTAYRVPGRELGETIFFDPSSRPLVETANGREPAHAETVLAHELGHAVFKLTSEQEVIDAIENPIRDQLGLPRRSRF
ncbi:MAG TPA: hypothetical protein VKH41_13890 [Myxococcota bacterium]|nr:hypothetical protein [Myxococcota bacterium]